MTVNDEQTNISLSEEAESSDESAINDSKLKKDEFKPLVQLPKWLRIILMIIPGLLIAGFIVIVDKFIHPFPLGTITPPAVMAIGGIALFGIVVFGDMIYRNIFVYRMLRKESAKSKVYKEIIKEKKAEKEAKTRQEIIDEEEDDYEYDDDEEELEEDEELEEGLDELDEEIPEKEEYSYDIEEEDETYRIKSYVVRGGIITILLVNSVILLLSAAIFQYTVYGGFHAT